MTKTGYALSFAAFTAVLALCVCAGSVNISLKDTFAAVWGAVSGRELSEGLGSIIVYVRLPRVICAALSGAALSLSGGAMQGLLRNPLADGSTLGVSSGASLGAVAAIALGLTFPALPFSGTAVVAVIFSFLSLLIILSIAYKLDLSLSTNTIILVGVIFSMFAHSIISFIITFFPERIKSITFWTMGSLSGSTYQNAMLLAFTLAFFGAVIILRARELNAFATGEDNARHIGVNIRSVKLTILIASSALIGICVSIGGSIGFVGLIIPHMTRMLIGANHKKLLPYCVIFGSIFLMLADLAARTILSPIELPIGVVTSFIGSIVFIYIFYSSRKAHK